MLTRTSILRGAALAGLSVVLGLVAGVAVAEPAPATAPTKPWGKLMLPSGKAWELTKPEITVGTDSASDVVLADATVAPHHFRITFAEGNATVEDLGSPSGTLVAGTAIKPGRPFKVLNKVEIDAGAMRLQFEFLERGRIAATQAPKLRAGKAAAKSRKHK